MLVDSQADISVIKIGSFSNIENLNGSEIVNIKGVIPHGKVSSFGTYNSQIFINDRSINHKLHVVPDDFNIPSDGILGRDFIKLFRCSLNYNKMRISLYYKDEKLYIPMYQGPKQNIIVIPARSEVIRYFHLQDFKSIRFIDSQEIDDGVFVAKTIAYSENTYVRILNTSNETKLLRNNNLISEDISNFDIYSINSVKKSEERTKTLLSILKENMPKYAGDKLTLLCEEFADIFALETDQMTTNNFYKQTLRLNDKTPVYVKNYRIPKTQKTEIETQVKKLLEHDLIEPSTSNYNSPLLLVPKKGSKERKWRLCVDYRLLNKKLVADKFPLPRIDDILDSLGRAKYFSILDLYAGFHQIPIEENSRDITSFSTDKGSFRWKVLPFGLNVSPNSFARMMAIAFAGISPEQAFLYLDDIIVIGCSENHHLENLKSIFQTLRKFNLKVNPQKCQFFRSEVTFLGHRCTENGILPDNNKFRAIEKYPIPQDKDSVKRFVAFANYYRRFIKNFAILAQPLNHLTRKNTEYKWTDECQKAFETLKQKLINPPILKYPDFSKEFIVTVDASKKACGFVLSQTYGEHDLPIYFASRSFTKGEQNKSTIEQELLAIYYAVQYFKPYIYGTHFRVKSDHKPLIYLFGLKDPNSKLTRIRLELEEYNFTVEHIKGTKNVTADALSRVTIDELKDMVTTANIFAITRSMTRNEQKSENPKQVTNETIKDDVKVIELNESKFDKRIPRIKCKNIKSSCKMVPKLSAYSKFKKQFEIDLSKTFTSETVSLVKLLSMLEKEAGKNKIKAIQWPKNDEIFQIIRINELKEAGNKILKNLQIILINQPKKVTDENEKLELMKRFHDDPIFGGHVGQKKLYSKLRAQYFWKHMTRDIAKYVRNCKKCLVNKVKIASKEEMVLTPTPQRPFDIVILDTIGPLPKSNNENIYAVTLICDLTKYLVAIAIPNKEAKTIAKAIFENFVLIYGPMKNVRTDLGTEYKNKIIDELFKLLRIKHDLSTAYHHQTLGTVERNHRFLNEYIRAYLTENQSDWDVFLKYYTFCYNITTSSSLGEKYTPYELVFSKKANMPDNLNLDSKMIDPIYNIDDFAKEAKFRLQKANKEAQILLEKSKMRNKKYYDKTSKPLQIELNDLILIEKEPRDKHRAIYTGPFKTTKIIGSNVEYFDDKKMKTNIVHKDRVRRCQATTN